MVLRVVACCKLVLRVVTSYRVVLYVLQRVVTWCDVLRVAACCSMPIDG